MNFIHIVNIYKDNKIIHNYNIIIKKFDQHINCILEENQYG